MTCSFFLSAWEIQMEIEFVAEAFQPENDSTLTTQDSVIMPQAWQAITHSSVFECPVSQTADSNNIAKS